MYAVSVPQIARAFERACAHAPEHLDAKRLCWNARSSCMSSSNNGVNRIPTHVSDRSYAFQLLAAFPGNHTVGRPQHCCCNARARTTSLLDSLMSAISRLPLLPCVLIRTWSWHTLPICSELNTAQSGPMVACRHISCTLVERLDRQGKANTEQKRNPEKGEPQ